MTDVLLRPLAVFAFCVAAVAPTSAAKYQSNSELVGDLKKLASAHSAIVKLSSLAKSRSGHDVWLVRVGSGDDKKIEQRPAGKPITIFKSCGLGVEDVAAAAYVYERLV